MKPSADDKPSTRGRRQASVLLWTLLGGILGTLWGFYGVTMVLFAVSGPALDQGGMIALLTAPVGGVAGAITGGSGAARNGAGLCGGIAALLATPVAAVVMLRSRMPLIPGMGMYDVAVIPCVAGLLGWCVGTLFLGGKRNPPRP